MKEPLTKPFSDSLEDWLKSKGSKTVSSLGEVFGEKSFAITFLILMSVPAIPLPTGGITHVFEIITMLLALELIIGQRSIWLPKRWKHRKLSAAIEKKALPYLIKKVRWLEKYSRPRLSGVLANRFTISTIGLVVLGLSLTAFLAPPFSGLDTLPALGVVFIALGMILEDIMGALIGLITGTLGVVLVVGLSKVILNLIP